MLKASLLRKLCVTFLVAGFIAKCASTGRPTRHLAFRKGSSFFYRVNYKINLLPPSSIFAYAAGFKVVWQLPTRPFETHRLARSILNVQDIELLYERHGFDGKSCALKSTCQILQQLDSKDGVVGKIVKLLTSSKLDSDDCEESIRRCPLELMGINHFLHDRAPT